jgi:hypothetical protein
MNLLGVRNTAIAVLAASPILALFLACGGSSGGSGGSSSGSGSGGSSGSSSGSSGSSSGGLPTGTPTIAITSPTAGASVAVTPPTDFVSIGFTATNFQFAAAGTCPADLVNTDNCGHIHVLVDGNDCTPDGSPYNNATGAPPVTSVNAILSECPMVDGSHTAQLQLHHDNHTPIDNDAGVNIAASVQFTATGG